LGGGGKKDNFQELRGETKILCGKAHGQENGNALDGRREATARKGERVGVTG